MEEAYGIVPPPMPEGVTSDYAPAEDPLALEVERLLVVCELRLARAKQHYDMTGFLKLGVALDRLRYRLNHRLIKNEQAKEVLLQVLDRIGTRERSCPDG